MYIDLDAFNDFESFNSFNQQAYNNPFTRPSEVHASAHAIQRFRERTVLVTMNDINRFIQSALAWGKDVYSYTGPNRQYLLAKTAHNYWPITYQGVLLLLSPDKRTVVTVYLLPSWFYDELPTCNVARYSLFKSFLERFKKLKKHRKSCFE